MQGKITKRAVDGLRVPEAGEAVLWDSEIKGFGVRIQRGGAKTYILQYRAGSGRGVPLRKYTIGRHGSPWTVTNARTEARRVLGLVASGKDPAALKTAKREAETVADLAKDFLTKHLETKRKARTIEEYRRLLDKIILPSLGKRKVRDVARAEVAKLHHGLREAPYEANRVLAVLSKMFALAEAWGLRDAAAGNPARGIEKYPEQKRERMLSAEELGRLGDALRAYQEAGGSPYVAGAVGLLVFTGARLSEVLGLRWEWIDFERAEARLPDSKSGAKTIHLPAPAMAVLASLVRLDANPHVIMGMKPGMPLVNLEKPWRAIRSMAGLHDLRLHDLRHAFASIAASSGMSLPIIGKMLGHTQAATTARYAHLASDPVKAATASVADKIDQAMNCRAEGTVVRLTAASLKIFG